MTDREQLKKLVDIGNRWRNTPIVDDDFVTLKNEFDHELGRAMKLVQTPRPKVVCLCGSTRFRDAFEEALKEETLAGGIVLSVAVFGHAEALDMNGPIKKALDELHFRKIEMADEVLILNVGKYIGESTRRELEYSRKLGKTIRFLESEE